MERYELTDDHALDYEETERLITRMQRGTIVEERRAGRNSVRLSIQKRSPRTTGDQNTLGISVNEIEQYYFLYFQKYEIVHVYGIFIIISDWMKGSQQWRGPSLEYWRKWI